MEYVLIRKHRNYLPHQTSNKQITGGSPTLWTRIQKCLLCPWGPWFANDHVVACLQNKTVPKNLIWNESSQWLLNSGIKIAGALTTLMSTPMGKWPWHGSSTGQDNSNELDLEWIGPVGLQYSKSPYHTDGHAQYYLFISWYLLVWNGVAVAAYIRLASRSQAKFQNNWNWVTLRLPCAAALCTEHGIRLSFTRFSLSDLFSAGQAGGFLATATPFHTWRYQLIIR